MQHTLTVVTVIATSPPRTARQLLLNRDFGILFWGKLGTLVAAWSYFVLSVTVTFDVTGSATWVGIVGAANLVPQLGLALVAGRLSDQVGPRLPIVLGVALSGVGSVGLAVWTAMVPVSSAPGAPWALVGSSLIFGAGLALSSPGMNSAAPALVRSDELPTAAALVFFPTALGRALGPALGAAVTQVASSAVALFLVGAISGVAAAALARIRVESPDKRASDASIAAALRHVAANRRLLTLLLGVAALAIGAEPAITLAPVLAQDVGSADGSGVVAASFGVGGVGGVLAHRFAARRLDPATEGVVALVLLATGMMTAASAAGLAMLVLGMALGGVAVMMGMTALSVAVQRHTDPLMMGRVMALWTLAYAGSRPFASFAQGLSSDHLGTSFTLLATVAVVLASAWGVRRATAPGHEVESDRVSGGAADGDGLAA